MRFFDILLPALLSYSVLSFAQTPAPDEASMATYRLTSMEALPVEIKKKLRFQIINEKIFNSSSLHQTVDNGQVNNWLPDLRGYYHNRGGDCYLYNLLRYERGTAIKFEGGEVLRLDPDYVPASRETAEPMVALDGGQAKSRGSSIDYFFLHLLLEKGIRLQCKDEIENNFSIEKFNKVMSGVMKVYIAK